MKKQNLEKKTKQTLSLTLATHKMKYLGINLTAYIQEPYEKNYKTLMKSKK